MGEKEEQTLSRLELADYLHNLSEELRRGALAAQGRHWNLEHTVANRQQEVMLHELRDLQNCMSSCHREFKSRGGTGNE
jgi:hypothetical protein